MSQVKYLKLLTPFPVNIVSGRTDIAGTLYFAPDLVHSCMPYYDVVDEDAESPNYNKPLIESYIKDNILTTFNRIITEPVVAPVYSGILFGIGVYYSEGSGVNN